MVDPNELQFFIKYFVFSKFETCPTQKITICPNITSSNFQLPYVLAQLIIQVV